MSNHHTLCKIHTTEAVTNYCCLSECLTPLCPDCIDEHVKKHSTERSTPEIDTLSRVKRMCENRLSNASNTLTEQLRRLRSAENINFEDAIKKITCDLETIRARLIAHINQKFKQLHEEYNAKMRTINSDFPDFAALKNKLSTILNEVKDIRINLDSNKVFDSVNYCCRLDLTKLETEVSRWVNDALATSINIPTNLIFNDQYAFEFDQFLNNVVSLDVNRVKLVLNENELRNQTGRIQCEQNVMVESYFMNKFKKI